MNPLERAAHAKELLENRVFKEVQGEIRNELISAIESVPATDIERMQELVLSLQLFNRHRKKLEKWVEEGAFEQKKLDAKNWREKVAQRWKG